MIYTPKQHWSFTQAMVPVFSHAISNIEVFSPVYVYTGSGCGQHLIVHSDKQRDAWDELLQQIKDIEDGK